MVTLLAVCCLLACCGVADLLGEQNERQERREARTALVRYLTRLQNGDYYAAYRQLCLDVLPECSEAAHAVRHRPGRRAAYVVGHGRRRAGVRPRPMAAVAR
ncbi:hypothetical protein EV384_4943 [Micromonospora kangleipakensis]|uniref:Uncharacterized protein n=2 Tax=Micromonospora kangleipakensis TaxID=1077942 RepID=A0A4Q8BFW6_9ACTN|nr:hypothetical protein EV384_4943 [Micromonospora kangleipakensis]